MPYENDVTRFKKTLMLYLGQFLDRLDKNNETAVFPLSDDHPLVLSVRDLRELMGGHLPHRDCHHMPARTWRRLKGSCDAGDAGAAYTYGCDLYAWADETIDEVI